MTKKGEHGEPWRKDPWGNVADSYSNLPRGADMEHALLCVNVLDGLNPGALAEFIQVAMSCCGAPRLRAAYRNLMGEEAADECVHDCYAVEKEKADETRTQRPLQ